MAKQLTRCPSCQKGTLKATTLACEVCNTRLEGNFHVSLFMKLSDEDQAFAMDFIKIGGSLKDLAKKLGISYPTVRNRLDRLIEQIHELEKTDTQTTLSRQEIMEQLVSNKISPQEAIDYLAKL